MAKYACGPWSLGEPTEKGKRWISSPAWSKFAMAYVTVDDEIDEEGEANARLIAAAPELLEACKAAQTALKKRLQGIMMLDAAIAKAEGRE